MLIIIRGLPGSGKSTLAKTFKGFVHLENDMYHIKNGEYCFDKSVQQDAVKWCFRTAMVFLNNGKDVVVSNTFTQKRFINGYVRVAQELGIPYKVIRMTKNYGNIHDVPADVYESMRTHFEDFEGEEIYGE